MTKLKPRWDVHSRGEKIGLVLPVKPSNPPWRMIQQGRLSSTICAFHFGLVQRIVNVSTVTVKPFGGAAMVEVDPGNWTGS